MSMYIHITLVGFSLTSRGLPLYCNFLHYKRLHIQNLQGSLYTSPYLIICDVKGGFKGGSNYAAMMSIERSSRTVDKKLMIN